MIQKPKLTWKKNTFAGAQMYSATTQFIYLDLPLVIKGAFKKIINIFFNKRFTAFLERNLWNYIQQHIL